MTLKIMPANFWRKDPFRSEEGEFERMARQVHEMPETGATPKQKRLLKQEMEYLKSRYTAARLTLLPESMWRDMGNTGSFGVKNLNDLKRNLRADGVTRDIGRIEKQFLVDKKVSASIALQYSDGFVELVAGNTRLSMARVLGIQPRIVLVVTDW